MWLVTGSCTVPVGCLRDAGMRPATCKIALLRSPLLLLNDSAAASTYIYLPATSASHCAAKQCKLQFTAVHVLQVVQVAVIVGKMYFVMPQMPDSVQDHVLEVWLQVASQSSHDLVLMQA